MRQRLQALLTRALERAVDGGALRVGSVPGVEIEVPREREHGDLACAVALALAREAHQPPRAIAETIVEHLEDPDGVIASTEVAGPGFLNFRFTRAFWHQCLREAEMAGERYGLSTMNVGRRFSVEFVSANPTGPLTVGHGRNAVLGDVIARLMQATGADVWREYYFNNAGRQMTLLAESVRARYLQSVGREAAIPENGYQGEYIVAIAEELRVRRGDGMNGNDLAPFQEAAERTILADIHKTLKRMDIEFDTYVGEDGLHRTGEVRDTLAELRRAGYAKDRDGAVWLCDVPGLKQPRVLVKSSGEAAYRLPDIAYHRVKLRHGYDLIVDVLGADHIDEHEEVKAALLGLGLETGNIRGVIYQFVTLTRDGEQVKMSTRRAQFVTLDELLDEVGIDAVRFFFAFRKSDSHLEFDLELAKKESTENPVYYIQYAHARIESVLRQAAERGLPMSGGDASLLVDDGEIDLIRAVAQFPDLVLGAATDMEPHRIAFFLLQFAGTFHRYYNRQRIITDDLALTGARLLLVRNVRQVLRNGLGLLGVGAPKRMEPRSAGSSTR